MTFIAPLITGESDLSVTRTDLLAALALAANWSRDTATWEADQTTDSVMWLKSAVRQFYGAHDWSFLRLSFTVSLTVGVEAYDLPTDYAEMNGPLYYRGNHAHCPPIVRTGMAEVWRGRGVSETGVPRQYAVEPLPQTGESESQRYALHFDKKPSQAFEVSGEYLCNPYALSSTRPYPLGGPMFAEALRYCVMATTELELTKTIGVYNAKYEKLLAECIKRDIRRGPTNLGKNRTSQRASAPFELVPTITTVRYNGEPVT